MEISTTASEGSPFNSLNPDGSQATWLEAVSEPKRRKAFIWRAGVGTGIALLIWSLQFASGTLFSSVALWGLIPLAIGLLSAYSTYQAAEVRRYSTTTNARTRKQRLRRAGPWWAIGFVSIGLVWWIQFEKGNFQQAWWYVWPLLLFFIVGLGLYRLSREIVLTADAAAAQAHFEKLAQQPSTTPTEPTAFDRFVERPFVHYPLAAALLAGAYYFAFESQEKSSGWVALGCLSLAGLAAHEAAKWLLGLSLIGVLIWAIVAGISILPVSAAIIIGALIIAGSLKR